MAYSFLKISTFGSHNTLESVDGGMEFLMATARTLLSWVQAIHNHQNDRVCARQKENIPVELSTAFRRQKPPSVMVWVGVTMDRRKTPLVFIEEGVKIDQAVYPSKQYDIHAILVFDSNIWIKN